MAKSLIIVESPAKAKTIHKYLGSKFLVKASVGHIKDLPPKKLGVDIEQNFQPEYVTIRGKNTVIQELKDAAKQVESIYLAPDPDREGEAISWHIAEELKKSKNVTPNIYRVMFNEITPKAIAEAMKHPGPININKVDAQQARRILDRLVGYKISPLLWKKVQKGLSAGRVQSVALRLICEREREIQAFVSEEYWSITAQLEGKVPPAFEAKLIKIGRTKANITNEQQATTIVNELRQPQLQFIVESVTQKETQRKPVAPFTTSTLQQEAARKLRFAAKKTMTIAQKLYEGMEIGEDSPVGLITYMRTDSTRISDDALQETRTYIEEKFGKSYLPAKPHSYKTQKAAQEAHEAIRPTSVYREPERLKAYLSKDELNLYTLIWKRLVASQMKPAVMDVTTIDILAGTYLFRASGSVLKFAGFMQLYIESTDAPSDQENNQNGNGSQNGEKDVLLPPLEQGEKLNLLDLISKQHFTQPPPRYTEASLVKELEKCGIGRPSTYASIISTILDREYVSREERKLIPTELGLLITDLLVENFPQILNVGFTANLEEQLDKIEEGELNWIQSLQTFYQSFSQELERAAKEMRNVKQEREEVTDEKCEKCGSPMKIKYGRYGKFLACSDFPKCRNTKPLGSSEERTNVEPSAQPSTEPETQEMCEKCGKPMILKRGRYGEFLACSGYPECKNTKKIVQSKNGEKAVKKAVIETDEICEKCGAKLVIREGRYGKFYSCSNYPKCKFVKPVGTGVKCPEEGCGGELVQRRGKNRTFFYSCSNYPTCKYSLKNKPVPRACPQCHAPFLVEKWDKNTEQTYIACANPQCDYAEHAVGV
ncbi:DNA topoisomerase I [Candidatus Vecturithrix granuli]|uniref:DNA topoisomerase 1 n=1 Tax=Vecturithrix granuli TaxID=1499967 RepID=A0A081C1T5_VECG1|nr:DNA topoisomerase I [Candidatus Vecturithrix granuli]